MNNKPYLSKIQLPSARIVCLAVIDTVLSTLPVGKHFSICFVKYKSFEQLFCFHQYVMLGMVIIILEVNILAFKQKGIYLRQDTDLGWCYKWFVMFDNVFAELLPFGIFLEW